MARFIFTDKFNWRIPGSRSMIEYKPREEPQTVKREVAEAAEKAGCGKFADDLDGDDDAEAAAGAAGDVDGQDPDEGGATDDDDLVLDGGADADAPDSTGG